MTECLSKRQEHCRAHDSSSSWSRGLVNCKQKRRLTRSSCYACGDVSHISTHVSLEEDDAAYVCDAELCDMSGGSKSMQDLNIARSTITASIGSL